MDDVTARAWRSALWVLKALPPTRRVGDDTAAPRRRRKLLASIDAIGLASGEAGRSLAEQVVPGSPFGFCLLW